MGGLGEMEESLFKESDQTDDELGEQMREGGHGVDSRKAVKNYQQIEPGVPAESSSGRMRFLAVTGGWTLSKQSIVDLWSNVTTTVCAMPSPVQGLVDLRTAAQMLNAIGLSAADVIARVATGKLRAYCSKPVSSLLDALMFSQQDIQVYVWERQRKNTQRKREDELLNRSVTVSRSRLRRSHCH